MNTVSITSSDDSNCRKLDLVEHESGENYFVGRTDDGRIGVYAATTAPDGRFARQGILFRDVANEAEAIEQARPFLKEWLKDLAAHDRLG